MTTQPEPTTEAGRPRATLIGLFATNEGDEAMLNEIADAIEAEALAAAAEPPALESRLRPDLEPGSDPTHDFDGPDPFAEPPALDAHAAYREGRRAVWAELIELANEGIEASSEARLASEEQR